MNEEMDERNLDEENTAEEAYTIEEQLRSRQFKRDLAMAVNKNSMENCCNLPDYVIAEHLASCFSALCETVDWINKKQ